MDIEDPIRKLLSTTGWSCDDLLEKLQKFKSSSADVNAEKKVSSKPPSPGNSDISNILNGDSKSSLNNDDAENPTEPPTVSNVSSTAETDECDRSCSEGNLKIISCISLASNTSKSVTSESNTMSISPDSEIETGKSNTIADGTSPAPKTTVEDGNTTIEFPVIANTSTISSTSSTQSVIVVNDDFSDTDEEEDEVNNTNSSIINEIIEDIDKGDNLEVEPAPQAVDKDCGVEQTTEVTEVRVIEINSDDDDDEDDNFEDECYNPNANLESSQKIQCIEVHPRHNIDDPPKLVPEVSDNRDIIENNVAVIPVDEKSQSNGVGEIQTNAQTDIPVHIEDSEDSDEPIDNTDKILIINDDTDTCHAQTDDSSNLSIFVTKTADDIDVAETSDGHGKIKVLDNFLIEPGRSNNESSSPERTAEEENADLENLEDIRNNLKKQLSCLRTRKKEHFLKDLTSKVDNPFECNEKLANFGKKQTTADVDVIQSTTDDNHLYNQTYELGFVISSVQGGIELEDNPKDKIDDENTTTTTIDSQKNSESSVDSAEASPHQDNQVFDEIRRIINKQKPHTPRIFVNKELAKPPREFSSNTSNSFQMSSPENSQSSFTLDQNTKHISPFVSNTLDEFLTGDAKLNISYNVPKCGAEEGLKENTPDISPLLLKRVVKLKEEVPMIPGQKPEKKLKAKTVAQKRKLLEMEHKRKLKQIKKEENKLTTDNKKWIKSQSYVMVDGQKLWVKSSSANTCIATINSSKYAAGNSRQRKLSLLKKEKRHKKLKYLPGPLCKKQILQLNGLANWETEVRTLPKVTLEVEPKIGQPMCQMVRSRLPPCNGDITEDQIDLALSVLKTDTTETKKFIFPMHYRYHQEQIIVKKRKSVSSVIDHLYSIKDTKKSEEDAVAEVIEGLIRYVEIKEIAPTLIKEEPIKVEDQVDTDQKSISSVDEKITVFKKPAKKKSKFDMELFRLSCKVVSVEVEEKDEETPCLKPYCRLGCVCKSIRCEHVPNLHCQKVKCMFDCTCPKERHWTYDHKLTLPAASPLLATDTVSRIEDEAKRNLAKVERDFTQTIIYTNDKTIVVGLGARNRNKRLTKVPKKYSDYYDASLESKELDERDCLRANCSVSLSQLNLSDVIPFCLKHNLYSCHCKGQSDYIPRKHKYSNERSMYKYARICPSVVEAKKPPPPAKTKSDVVATPTPEIPPPQETSSEIKSNEPSPRPKRKRQLSAKFSDSAEEYPCDAARVNPVPYNRRRKRHIYPCKHDFIYNITDADIYKARLKSMQNNGQQLEVDILKEYLIGVAQSAKVEDNPSGKKKRKQILEVRKDDTPLAIQRRKKAVAVRQALPVIAPVFDGEIIVDHTNMELLRKMGRKTVQDGYARLLPWKALTEAYRKGTVIIWSMIGQPSRLLMNKSDKKAPKNYVDIKETTHTTEVIMWLLRNKLPSVYEEDNVSFILRETKDNFEICGVCTKNLRESLLPDTTMESDTDAVLEARGPITNFIHKDSQGNSQVLDMVKEKFKLQELMEESLGALGDTSIKPDKLYMWAELPEIYGFYKWKMIYLNSDFAYLFFNSIKYSIKYTDLIAAGRISKSSGYTVIMRNKQMLEKYEHKLYGLYFDPNYLDRVFLGPYPKQFQDADVETMRYINKTLVCTESFNKMRGKGDYKCGYWLIERPYNRVRRSIAESTIDLTNDDAVIDRPKNIKKHNYSIMHNNEPVRIIDAPPRKPEDFNRYLITNIPHFGYLGAYQYAQSSEIDVSWPFENKMLRFQNVTSAIDFLQERLSTLLQPVPATFKIHIIVLTSLDVTNSKPIDANVLSGYFICGEFGYYNILQITDEICKEKIGKSKEQVLRMFAKKAQEIVKKRASTLSSLINIKTTTKDLDIIEVLDTATAEIKKLREQEDQYLNLKIQLTKDKRTNAIKLFNMIGLLPEDEKVRECTKLRSIINNTETIEIADSDEEREPSPPSSSNKQLSPPSKELVALPHLAGAIQSPAKMMSVLKPLIRVPIDKATSLLARGETSVTDQGSSGTEDSKSNLPGRLIQGVKLIKTSTGNFVIVPDNAKSHQHRKPLSPGTKIIIKNNKIQRISKDVDADDHHVHPEGDVVSKCVENPVESVAKPKEIVETRVDADTR